MQEINELLKKYKLKPIKYRKIKKTLLIETSNGKYSIKENTPNKTKIYEYLKSRNFDYIPNIITKDKDDYEITEFVESYAIPKEQKIIDMIDLISLLHNKTTHYKEVTEDDYKEIYEKIKNRIEYLYNYYTDTITIIDTKIYMSPSEYALARNISIIFQTINFINKEIDSWYNIVKEKTKIRQTIIHNNLELDHYISNDKKYLISWDNAKIDMPIYDIYKLYINHGLEYDFSELLKRYEKNYHLHEDEKKLLFILISIPPIISKKNTEYENCVEINKLIEIMYKTKKLISPYYSKHRKEDDEQKNKN